MTPADGLPVAAPDHAAVIERALKQRMEGRYRANARTLEVVAGSYERVPAGQAEQDALAALRALLAERQQDKQRIERLREALLTATDCGGSFAGTVTNGSSPAICPGCIAVARAALAVEEDAE